ncbi:hypothetical protein [Phaeobacter sp. SYSU ZJ3003]|uniref:hypothetical protein n=1 Tax=Phaeobacter sp. SYSU ZJ3003 TaxID=2109330 RepID=UPI00351C2A0D
MAETHELRLKIDAGAAHSGARQFKGAIEAVRAAVRGLEKDSAGAFTKLRSIKPEIDVTPLTRATTETNKLTSASDKAQQPSLRPPVPCARLNRRRSASLSAWGTLAILPVSLSLKPPCSTCASSLTNATSTLGVVAAKSQFDDLRSSLLQTTVTAEYSRGEQAQLAREMEEASRSAATHGETLDRLRAKYNPLYSASKQ